MVTKRFNLLFRLRKPANYSQGNMHVYMRITVDSNRVEPLTNRNFDATRSNARTGRAIGTKEDAKSLNAFPDTMQIKVYEAHREILTANQIPTVEKIKNLLQRKETESPKMLLEIFLEHNKNMEKLIKKNEFARGTLTHFNTALTHTKSFIKIKCKASDINIDRIDFSFVNDFEFYLKSEICAHNTAMKLMQLF